MRAHGFSVRASTKSADCEGFDVSSMRRDEIPVIAVSNDLTGSGSDASNREGWMSCLLRRGPLWGSKPRIDLNAPPNSPIFSGRKAEFSYQNVECSLYPSDDEHADAQIARANGAFRALLSR